MEWFQGLAWYWWVLGGLAVVAIVYLKLKVFSALMRRQEQRRAFREQNEEM